MGTVQLFRVSLAAAVVFAAAGVASGQQSTPEAEINWLPANWEKTCIGDGERESCFTSIQQLAMLPGNDKPTVMAGAALQQVPSRPDARRFLIRTPLETRLRDGVLYSIDGAEPSKMEFDSCSPTGCVAALSANDNLISSLKRGGEIRVQFSTPLGRPLQLGLTLKGFTAAYESEGERAQATAPGSSTQAPSRPSKGNAPPQ